ncbi:translational elongation factor EF-1 alpha [Globomyces sp. JEL0801]|nr:translational elongation factor EF-1 alpha [Globomyces sp. JEL0801]
MLAPNQKLDLSTLDEHSLLWEKHIATIDKKNQDNTNDALKTDLVKTQPYLIKALPFILNACGDKKSTPETRANAEEAVALITSVISPNAVRETLPHLFEALHISKRFQTRVAALNAIASFADHAPEQLGHALPDVIPQVSQCVIDLKKEVGDAAEKCMLTILEVVGNRDVEHLTPAIVRSITHPEESDELMNKLAGVTFVQSVESPALAMVTPLLVKGLTAQKTATIRQAAVIIDNMSRLVDDPLDAAPFLPLLLPVLEKAADMMSDPEARNVAERSVAQLKTLDADVQEAAALQQHIDPARVLKSIETKMGLGAKKGGKAAKVPVDVNHVYFAHIANLCCSLMAIRKFGKESWEEVRSHLAVVDEAKSKACIDELRKDCQAMVKPLPSKDDQMDDPALELCNCQFTLAYGTKILLHNAKLKLLRGAKYGLLGGNDSGKTTLMRAIANGSVEGFPDPSEVKTVFVEADILGELSHLSCVDYIMADPALQDMDRDQVLSVMASVGFTHDGKAKPTNPVSSLSGGWRMKLAMARAMLQNADILLLDEPTNHLDVINVAWVKNYINSLTNVTCIMVSHDSGFLRECCTNIIQIKNLKLKQFRGNLDEFIKHNPEAQSYFNIKSSKLKFTFPQPGPIEGIKSRSRALMKMQKCYFTYPGNDKPTLHDINIQVSMASRVGCVGENGAGKSTMIKVLTGELVPQQGDVYMNPNARVAYVAQHAFHHIEQHLDKTPNEYIRWRYEGGTDKESLVKVSMVFTPEEEALQKKPFEVKDPVSGKLVKRVVIECVGNRRKAKSGDMEYEVRFQGESVNSNGIYIPGKTLAKQGWDKALKAIDMRVAQNSGLQMRALSSVNVEKHINEVGLEPEFASHSRMGALSGGQKVKVVLAAALWNEPHILILDEPTNYLDRESLGALAGAIEEYKGGVVIISHHNEFVKTLCTEEWVMDAGHLTTKGDSGWMDRQDDKINDQQQIESIVDATGNTVQIKQKKKLSKREEKVFLKNLKAKIDNGEDLDSDEESYAQEKGLF